MDKKIHIRSRQAKSTICQSIENSSFNFNAETNILAAIISRHSTDASGRFIQTQDCGMNGPVQLLATTGSLNLGGSTTFLLNLALAFRERGERLPVMSFSANNEMEKDFAANGLAAWCLPRPSEIYEDRILSVYQTTAQWRPRAVMACLSAESFEVLRIVPPGVVRIGVVQSDDDLPYRTIRSFRPWLDAVVGVSSAIRDRLRDECEIARSVYIPYGIRFRPSAARPARTRDQPLRLIYLGRMTEVQKRVSRLVELVRNLAARNEPFRFTFVGSGPALAGMKTALKDLPQVAFLGEVSNQEVPDLLRSHDLFVLLSDFEGLPLSLLEAMGEGVVPVVSDLKSGIRDVVTHNTGVRVPVGDVAAATEAVMTLGRDRERLAALSRNAATLARSEYSAERMAQRYLDLLAEFPGATPSWPQQVEVPAPVVPHPWLFQGWPRKLRRWLKPVLRRGPV
jgi:glycosyltransferase involved in cell wall biosynthesis